MPSEQELQSIDQHVGRAGLRPWTALGTRPLLVTYAGPTGGDRLEAEWTSGQHLRAACLALRQGNTLEQLPARIFNLNHGPDYDRLVSGACFEGWNGVWIHQSHGAAGIVKGPGLYGGREFYNFAGKFILHRPGFQYGLMKTCHAASSHLVDGSVISQMAEAALRATGERPRLYGARCITWVPLAGTNFGYPLPDLGAAIETEVWKALGPAPEDDESDNEARGAAAEAVIAQFFSGDRDLLERVWDDPVNSLDEISSNISMNFRVSCAFDPAKALPLPASEEALAQLPPLGADARWYGVNI